MSFTPPPGPPGPYPGGPNPEQYGQPGGPPPQNPGAPPPLPGDGLPPSSGGAQPPSSGGALPPLPGDNAPYSSPPGPPGYGEAPPPGPPGYDQTSYGFDPAMSGPPAGGPPGYDPTGMYGPRPPGPESMPPPPQPPKSRTGMIVGIVAGAVVLLLLVGGGITAVAVHLHNSAKDRASEASASAAASESSSSSGYDESESPSSSPSPTARDASTLDEESTDETPFEMSQFFPNTVGSYSLAADGSFSACDDSGGSATQSLMNKHGCGDMATASYLDSGTYLASALVIPLTSADDANSVVSTFKEGGEAFTGLRYFCPKSGTGSSVCDAGNNPRWYAWYVSYHRYVLVTTILRLDGKDTDGSSSAAKSFATDVLYAIEDQMLVIQD